MGDIAAIATIVSAAASVAGGVQGMRAGNMQKQQYAEEAANTRVQAAEAEVERTRELRSVLATQDAVRAGRGLEFDSGTARALRDDTNYVFERDIDSIRYNAENKTRRLGLAGSQAQAQGTGALLSGFAQAGGALSRANFGSGGGGTTSTRPSQGGLPPGGY
jgi:hypothetical protein